MSENLSPDIRDLLDDLVHRHRRGEPPRPLGEEQRWLLVARLERALIDPSSLRPYLRHLRSLLGTNPPEGPEWADAEEPALDAEEQQVVVRGLANLAPERLARLAIHPVALLGLRAALFEPYELPEYW